MMNTSAQSTSLNFHELWALYNFFKNTDLNYVHTYLRY